MIGAVVFDVGETLVCEDRVWREWAEWYGVPPLTFMGTLGAVIERRQHHLAVFEAFDPSFSLASAEAARAAAGRSYSVSAADLYDDAAGCLAALRAAGYVVGVAGNQPPEVSERLCEGLDVDVVASSAAWGVEKPHPEFFARVASLVGCAPGEVAYVGDRVDNDVVPAKAAGMRSVFLRRGPWGYVHATWPEAAAADVRVESLAELPAVLETWRGEVA
ncbi:MAG TPA: HAD family hydrolase [Mycobacteriales bacterium]